MKLEGFGIFVENMGAMVRFYRDALGFEIREDEDTSNVYLVKDGNYPKWIKMIFNVCPDITSGQVCFCG